MRKFEHTLPSLVHIEGSAYLCTFPADLVAAVAFVTHVVALVACCRGRALGGMYCWIHCSLPLLSQASGIAPCPLVAQFLFPSLPFPASISLGCAVTRGCCPAKHKIKRDLKNDPCVCSQPSEAEGVVSSASLVVPALCCAECLTSYSSRGASRESEVTVLPARLDLSAGRRGPKRIEGSGLLASS